MIGQMRYLGGEGFRVAAEHRCFGTEVKPVVGRGEALQEPAAEVAGTTRYENALTSDFFPEMRSVIEDMV